MNEDKKPTQSDLDELIRLYEIAKSCSRPFEYESGHGKYPKAVEELFHFIHHSSWCYKIYESNDIDSNYEKIDELSLDELRAILTSLTRKEHYTAGWWESILGKDMFAPVIARLQTMLN